MCTPQCICEKLGGLGFEEAIKAWKYVRHYTENLQKLQVKLRDLGDCTATITREVSEAIGRDDEIEGSVLHWQTDADSLKVNIEQLIGESTTKASISCIACSCPNIVWRYKFSKQAEDKIANAVELIKNCNNFNHQISHPRSHYMENLQKLKDKLRDLGDCREIIRGKVSEANGRGDEIEVNVSHWQTDVDSLKADIERLISESTNICSTECPDITWQHKFSKQAEDKIANAVELITNCSNFNHQISHPRPRPPELESLSDKNYVNFDSRASIFKDIMDALKDSNVNMIGVFGLGGVGKTTLVKELGEQMRKDGTFKQVAMAVVSKDLNVKEVQSRLADSLNFEFKAKADYQERRATELWNKLANGDKYLIILDDIWEQVKMEAIGIPCTNENKGCKVVLTSRNEDLLRITMKVDRNFPIAELLEGEGWNLFKEKVGNTIESRPEIYSLAREVCRKCKGLPVAINALGAALEDKQEHAWRTALDKLDKYMLTKIEGIDRRVLASLRVSYDMLHSTDAKSCFLLCCMFAEDAEIPIDELMRLCVARNLLDQNPHTLDEARNDVRTVVGTLKSASLLTIGGHETVVKIHDVIRDVGISIAREEEAFLVDHGALRWPRNPTNEPSYKAMSLSFKNIKGLPDGLVYPRIHTLMVDNTNFSDLEVGDNFFNGMTQLVVLTVTRMRMKPLPSSLAKLTNLKMLYLNKCKLADIAMLKDLKSNLEVLSLRGSSIKVLPLEIGQLTSLRVLDLQDCDKLMVIPRGVISNLTGLEELYFPRTFDKWGTTTDEQQDTSHASLEELDTSSRSDNASLEELDTSSSDNASLEELDTSSSDNASLEELRSLANAQLTTLHIHIPNVKLLPKEDLKFADLKGFRISVGSKFYYFESLISRRCMLKLEGIRLRNEFIPLVDKAEVLILKPESSVHSLRLFDKLTVLIIEHFKLKYLFSPTTAKGLVHLEVLEVSSCEIMEGIVGFEERKDENEITGEVKFSKLKRLELTSLPNLISFFAKKEEMGTTMGSFSARAQPLFNELVMFPVLEVLTIGGLGNIIKIWDKQSVAIWQEQGSFCQLTSVNVHKCEKLMHLFSSNMNPLLKNLERLRVYHCETMKGIAEFEGEIDEDGLRNEVAASLALEVEHLEMVGVPKITEIRDKQPLPEPKKEVESLCRLMNIHIERCGQLLYVFPSHMLPQNLQELRIQDCNELEVIFSKDIIVFPRLQKVRLWYLPKLKSFYTETQGFFFSHKVVFPVLKRMEFWNLDKITRIWDDQPLSEPEKEAKSFSKLKDISVHGCDQLEYVLPSYMLPQLKNLQELKIQNCTKVEVIISNNPKEKEATNNNDTIRFPQLKTLELIDLPNLKSFIRCETQLLFSNKVAFPVLERLYFINLDKITRIWDNQPLSEPEKEAKSFCKLMVIKVDGCNQLEYVLPFYMLPLLKNLQELMIWDCRKMEVIIISNNSKEKEATNNNDTIRFPQLKTLELWGLPNLKSFICSETQLLFSNKDAFPVLEEIDLDEDSEILRDGTCTKEVSMENNKMADTSAAQARKGKDIQKIPWGRRNIITRDEYRQTRLKRYKNYENIPQSGEMSEKDCKVTMKGGMYYEFRHNSRSVKSKRLHYKLRNLVWATSKHDVYSMSLFSVTHWSALTWNKTEVLNVSGHVAPCEEHPGSLLEGFTKTKVSTLAVKDRLLVVGGFQGELICKNLDRPGVCFCTRTTYDDKGSTNVVEIYNAQSGAVHFTAANDDCGVRDFDMENFQLSKHFSFPWPVNHTSLSPDGKLRIIVGDSPDGMLVDSGTGKTVASLVGHSKFSIASAWHPDGLTFATGNQDKTCRIWDARNLSKSVVALKGNFGAIQSIRYSSDGRFMAMAEPTDFVHVFDAKSGYEKEQEIDFFGEISGMSFSPDTESLFIGVCDDFGVSAAIGLRDRTYGGLLELGGLLEFGRRRNNSCPDSIF